MVRCQEKESNPEVQGQATSRVGNRDLQQSVWLCDGQRKAGNWVHSHRAAVCFGVRFGLPVEVIFFL